MRYCLTGLLLLLFSLPAKALDCGGELIDHGAYRAKVEHECGAPFWTNSWTEASIVNPFGVIETGITVQVSQWYYNYGPNRLMRRLTFRNGQLVNIETLGYGVSGPPLENECEPGALQLADSMGEIVARCGLPVFREAWSGYRAVRPSGAFTQYQQVRYETWAYAFGSNRFTRYVTFANGQVVDIDIGERGGLSR